MGQAKARGSFEERKAEAMERNALETIERDKVQAKRRADREASPAGKRRARRHSGAHGIAIAAAAMVAVNVDPAGPIEE